MLLRRRDLRPGVRGDELFGRSGPLAIEVGFGDGRFLAALARVHPEWNLLGVEVSLASVSRAWRRLRREGAGAVILFRGNARFLVRDILPERSVDRVFINFPDPWPRKRHAANRLLSEAFFRLLSVRLVPGGEVHLTTDHEEYFGFARAEAGATGLFDEHPGPPPPGVLETKYALKWRADERRIRHVTWTLRRPGPPYPPHIAFEPMQHALVAGDLGAVREFTKTVRRFDGGTVIITEAFRTMKGDGILFTVVVEEPDLRQELLVRAFPKRTGIHVGLEPFGDAIGTRGAAEAVRAVVAWLVDQGMEVRRTWI